MVCRSFVRPGEVHAKGIVGAVLALAAVAARRRRGGGRSRVLAHDGTGSVFVPNPVQTLGDESLTDRRTPMPPFRPRRTGRSR